ncbi:dihydrodipicolinate synthase [Xylariaceae sp. FL0255]|nr:dihydrodipicolinate synthase [Xylariaceae sp. FL0255]
MAGQSSRSLPCGIWAPTTTFFDSETEDLDIPTIKRHAERLARAGLAGLVVGGSMGEAVHLNREEKAAVIKASREALDAAGYEKMPIMAGTTEPSVRGTLELIKLSANAGADAALILPPSFYRGAATEDMLMGYFTAVADKSALPIVIYNYPGAVAGIDMDSDLLVKLSQHPKIIGSKFTCGNSGKLTRVAAATNAKKPGSEGSGYLAFGGMCDFTVQTAASGGSGVIAGGANVMPKLCVKVWDLCAAGKIDEAIALQKLLSHGDWQLTKGAVPGTKQAIQSFFGYGGYPRRPLKRLDDAKVAEYAEALKEAMDVENSL